MSNPIDTYRIDIAERLAVLTMTKPPANTMEPVFLNALADAFDALAGDAEVGAVIVTGQGHVFSAGVDLKRVPDLDVAGQDALVRGLNRLYAAAFGCPKPVIGALNGHAIAGGLVLALCCDYRIAAGRRAQYGLTEVRVGVPFPEVAFEVIAHQLPAQTLRRLVQFGENVDAATALAWGVVDELVEEDGVLERAAAKARACLAIPPGGYQKVKRQLRGEVVDRCRGIVAADSDQFLGGWISEEARTAALAVLAGR